jgi:D-alanyl-D-alanine carboxypeptidase
MLRCGFPPQQQRFARASVQSIEAQAFLSFAEGCRFSRGMLAALMFRHPLRSSKAAAALLCLFAALVAQALPATAAPRYAAMAIDANTGSVLHNQAGDEPRYPASLTKMMTL